MSAHAITGPSWRPWDTQHAKGVAAAEMAIPERPDERDSKGDVIAARQMTHDEYADQIAQTLSSALFAALLEQQEYDRGNADAPSSEAADGASFVPEQPEASVRTASTAASTSDAASSSDTDSAQSERFGGVSVIVSGHSLDNREGVSLLNTVKGARVHLSPEIMAQMERDQGLSPAITELHSEAASPLPPGSTTHMPVTLGAQAGVLTPFDLRGGSQGVAEQYDTRAHSFLDLMDAEQQMQAEYGADAKLAYSHQDGGYIMLTPDDARYDDIASVRNGAGELFRDMGQGRLDPASVRDRLAGHGFYI